MLVSWNWLADYVTLDMEPEELAHRLSMAGLNHEGTRLVGDDLAIDLEVTSNRPDCLGHLGVAREIAVLWDRPLRVPAADVKEGEASVDELCQVRIECPELCYRYTARVIRGATVGPSPDWLATRLRTIGISTINNIVDITNYVMMECGQPLHAFDFSKINGREIIVRAARKDETFLAIDHRTYTLVSPVCVIADRRGAVALGGVMGGADSEVTDATTEILIEAAQFDPLSIRTTARRLNLHSPSSYRFERPVDPLGVDWASRRCCELILEIAGGQLARGVKDVVARPAAPRTPIVLRYGQLKRILGIDVKPDEVRRILAALGTQYVRSDQHHLQVTPPTWRQDLAREIDLIEEVARIHGYDKIPEDVSVPMVPSHRSDHDRVLDKIRRVLVASGLDEAITASVVSRQWSDAVSPWSSAEPIQCETPMLRGDDQLRRSLIPSLLGARQLNQSLGHADAELFEIARVYLPRDNDLPDERLMVGIVSQRDYFQLKGALEALLEALNPRLCFVVADADQELLDAGRASKLLIDGQICGYLGEVGEDGLKQFGLRGRSTVAELDATLLAAKACLIPRYRQQSPYPAICQDLNLVMDDRVRWADLAQSIRKAAGECLEQLEYRETYRDTQKDGPGKKRLFFSLTLRSADRTLTGGEAEEIRKRIIEACGRDHQAVLLS
jgi:phenylalanyl-tRNA synthetase beta chain